MITTKRNRIFNHPVTSHATIVKPPFKKLFYIDNTFGYEYVRKAYVIY